VAPNIAEIRIDEDGVRIQLEVFVGDLKTFDALVPDNWFKDGAPQRATPDERMVYFAENGLSIRRTDGTALPVIAEIVERRMRIDRASPLAGQLDPTTRKILPAPPDDPRVLYAELFYPFNGNRPDTLVFVPPLGEKSIARVSMGMVVFDREVPVIEFRYLAKAATLNIDWQDPWYSQFNNINLWRQNRFPQTAFLYIDPFEVRHEVLIRVRDASELVGMKPLGKWLTKAETERLINLTAAEIGARTPINLDGKPVSPTYDRAAYLNIGMRGLVILDDEARINVDAGILGLVWTVATDGYPHQAQLEWTIFNKNGLKVPAYAIDAAGPFLSRLRPDDSVLLWTNHFKTYKAPVIAPVVFGKERTLGVPVLTIFLILVTMGISVVMFRRITSSRTIKIVVLGALVVVTGVSTQFAWVTIENPLAGVPDERSIARITSQLTENLHNALQEKIPKRLDKALGVSISEDAFEDVKQEVERALVVEMQGGGSGLVYRIRDFSVASVQSASRNKGFQVSVNWKVTATGNHWGHPHLKNIRFSALMDIAPIDGAWMLTGMTVTNARLEI